VAENFELQEDLWRIVELEQHFSGSPALTLELLVGTLAIRGIQLAASFIIHNYLSL
jgi:hypothetical protein